MGVMKLLRKGAKKVAKKTAPEKKALPAKKSTSAVKDYGELTQKKSISKDDVIKYIGKHGVENARKYLGKDRVSKAGAKFTKDTSKRQKDIAKNKKGDTAKSKRTLNTPTGKKVAPRKAPKKPTNRGTATKEVRDARKSAPEEGKRSYTTRVGEGVGYNPKPKTKADKQRMSKKRRTARRQTEAQDPSAAFESRLNQEARAGGVQSPGPKARGSEKLRRQHEYSPDQASGYLRGRQSYPDVEPDDMDVKDILEIFESAAQRKSGGSVGAGKATKGYSNYWRKKK